MLPKSDLVRIGHMLMTLSGWFDLVLGSDVAM